MLSAKWEPFCSGLNMLVCSMTAGVASDNFITCETCISWSQPAQVSNTWKWHETCIKQNPINCNCSFMVWKLCGFLLHPSLTWWLVQWGHSFQGTRQNSTQSVGNMPLPSPRHLLPHVLQIMPRNPKYDQFQPKGHHNEENPQSMTKMPGNPKFYLFH